MHMVYKTSLEISKELDHQNKMLNTVNEDFEEAITGLDIVTRKTKDLVKKSGETGVPFPRPIVFLVYFVSKMGRLLKSHWPIILSHG